MSGQTIIPPRKPGRTKGSKNLASREIKLLCQGHAAEVVQNLMAIIRDKKPAAATTYQI